MSSGGRVGQANASSGGSSGSKLLRVDGVNITNTGFGGVGLLLEHVRSWARPALHFIEQIQVKTEGATPSTARPRRES